MQVAEIQPWRPPNPGSRWAVDSVATPPLALNQTTAPKTTKPQTPISLPTDPSLPPSYENVSNAGHSVYTIVNYKRNYSLCETIELTIQMHTLQNGNKTYGGDFIWVWVSDTTQRASSTADEITDNQDGTYTVKLTPRWTGHSIIGVNLVHSSEIVSHLSYFRGKYPARYSYKGIFNKIDNNTGQEVDEKLSCHMSTDMYIPRKERYTNMVFCNFTDKETGFPWFCLKPINFSCSQYDLHTSGGSAVEFHKTIMSKEFVKNYIK